MDRTYRMNGRTACASAGARPNRGLVLWTLGLVLTLLAGVAFGQGTAPTPGASGTAPARPPAGSPPGNRTPEARPVVPAPIPGAPAQRVPPGTAAAADQTSPRPAGQTAEAQTKLKAHEKYLLKRYPELASEITPQQLNEHLRALTRHPSRVVGYEGEREAAEYVHGQFQQIFGEVREERFRVTVPIDPGGELRLPGGKTFKLRALWPNLVRTSQLPKEGMEAPIIWAGTGKLSEFNGRDVAAAEPTISQGKAEEIARGGDRTLKFRGARLGLWEPGEAKDEGGRIKDERKPDPLHPSEHAPGGKPRLVWRVVMAPFTINEADVAATAAQEKAAILDARTGEVLTPLTPAARVRDLKRNTGAVVVVEFNTSSDWLNAPRLGAEAVIFVEPDQTMRGEAENKFLGIPVAIPRFWISKADAAQLIPLLQRKDPPRAVLSSNMRWETREGRNFIGRIDGWDPLDASDGGKRLAGVLKLEDAKKAQLAAILQKYQGRLNDPGTRAQAEAEIDRMLGQDQRNRWNEAKNARNQIIVLHAFYDAMSCVPSLAPGAENAISMAGLLELAKVFKKYPPRRTVWFLGTTAHFMGLQGIKAYLENHIDEFKAPGLSEKAAAFLTRSAGWLVAIPGVLRWLLVLALLGFFGWAIFQAFKRGSPGLGFGAVLSLIPLSVLLLTARPTPTRNPPQIYLFAGLDLSSNSKGVGIFYKGYFFNYREDIQNKFSDIARVTRENAEKVATVFGQDPKVIFADGVNPIEGKNWRNFFPGKMALDAEVWTLTGARGVGFSTIDDARQLVDTPFDTLDRVNVDNVATQTKTLACLVDHILNDTNSPGEIDTLRMPISEASQFSRMGLQGGFATVQGRVVRFDLKESFIPSTPVAGSLAVITNPNKTFMGVRGPMVQEVDANGNYKFVGIPPLTAFGGQATTQVQGYHIDPDTGDIDYAPDLGHTGAKAYPIEVQVTMPQKNVQVIVFKCESTSIYDFVDPQSLKTLSAVHIYDGATNAEPRMYGMAVAHPERFQAVVEDAAVFFAQPGFTIKVVMGAGPAATRFVLINSTYRRERKYNAEGQNEGKITQRGVPEGIGYKLGYQPAGGERPNEIPGVTHDRTYERTIPNMSYRVALDMWRWDDANVMKLAKYRIVNQQLDMLHNKAGQYLNEAEEAMARKDHAAAFALARMAHGYEARAYPEVQKTARDVVKGVMFYLALLLPFAFFLERLLIASPSLKNQLTWIFAIFILAFIVMTQIHPAFDITMSPMIVLLAFIMLALSVLVITLIAGKFEQQLKEFNKQVSGTHTADIGRMSIAAAAFSLGISNMRRRKARTILTCITLILLTFIVLSFTSVVTGIRYNVVPAPGVPRYDGVMLRSAMWEPLEESGFRLLNDEFGATKPVAPRAWFFGTQMGEQTFLRVNRGDKNFDARAVLGLSDEEPKITGVDQALLRGRWFLPTDTFATILTKESADQLGITEEAVDAGTARVRYAGNDYTVVGLVDNDQFKAIKDLDQEPLTPVDFILMQRQSSAGGGRGDSGGDAGFKEYTHLEPNTVFIIPYETLITQGGEVRSVAINLVDAGQVTKTRLDLMPRLGLNLYAGEGGQTYRYSAIGGTSIAGAAWIAVPILIASLIVLNTMLGAVFERQKEIHIYSSIGLAPNHVAMLFMAESLVYAILGAMAGYVLGQGMAKLIVALNIFHGLNLNFSSLSAVFSTALVMGVVMVSTLYPAKKAGEVATPAIERTWRTPEPVGDRWEIPLPFMVTGDQAMGLNQFLGEWFRAYEEYSIGDFVTQNVETSESETEAGKVYQIKLTAWLAPFDLGVSQIVELNTNPTDMEDVFELRLVIHRLSGDISNWKRVNRRFLNTLRKQFLIWRTLGSEERERYLAASEEVPVGAE
jgi:FtsX-like permease family protein/peptidase M28-like protein